MTRFYRAALAAALTLATTPLSATAEAERAPVSAHVIVRDLDLGSPSSQKMFEVRVARAAAAACGSAIDLRERFDVMRCRGEMRRAAAVRLAALMPRRPIELAAVYAR